MKQISFQTEHELKAWIPDFLVWVGDRRTIAFHGDLGSGKTTFVKYLCHGLEVLDRVSSPTFSIVNEYRTQAGDAIYHIDLYRLDSIEEVIDIGIEEYLDSGTWICIEWPELIAHLLPQDTVHVKIEVLGQVERKIVLL